jgi:hypothetical protein
MVLPEKVVEELSEEASHDWSDGGSVGVPASSSSRGLSSLSLFPQNTKMKNVGHKPNG